MEAEDNVGKKITIGVCVMEKKVKCGSEVLYFLFSIRINELFCRACTKIVLHSILISSRIGR